MAFRKRFEPRLFTSAEVEVASGISQDMQRDWRRRQFLPSHERKHGRWHPLEVAFALTMKSLNDDGLPPARCVQAAAQAAPSVLWCALEAFDRRAWRIVGPKPATDWYQAILTDDRYVKEYEEVTGISISKLVRFALLFSSGDVVPTGDLASAVEESTEATGHFLKLESLGALLVQRAGWLIQVDVE